MKSMTLFFGFAALALQATAEPPPPAAKPPLGDYDTVRTAEWFSLGATGAAASISETELAFRRILRTPTAADDCRKLTAQGTLAGQLYGLLGLKLLKDTNYNTIAARYRFSRKEVIVTEACSPTPRGAFFVVQLIDQGRIK